MDSILDEKSFRLESVRALNKQVVHLVFKDGKEFDLDLSPDLNSFQGPFVEPLKDQSVFSRVRVDYGSLVFPTGLDYGGDVLRLWCEHGGVADPEKTDELAKKYRSQSFLLTATAGN
jgi:hypothetical protein